MPKHVSIWVKFTFPGDDLKGCVADLKSDLEDVYGKTVEWEVVDGKTMEYEVKPSVPMAKMVKVMDVESMPWPGPDGPAEPDDLWEVTGEEGDMVTIRWNNQQVLRRLFVEQGLTTVHKSRIRGAS